MTSSLTIVQFDAARKALAEARNLDEIKDVRDKAEALRLYVRQADESLEMQNDIAEIKLRAERRAGKLLQELERATPGPTVIIADQPGPQLSPYRSAITASNIALSTAKRWQQAAALPEADFEAHIVEVKTGAAELTSAGVLRLAKELAREEKRQANRELVEQTPPVMSVVTGSTYQTIVLDPPWDWGDEGDCDQYGRARPTYATMPISEIAGLPIAELAASNAHIYLWITNRSLPKGFPLLEAWGFRYITAITWVKPSFGMGNYFRGSTEHVLFGVRGSLPLLRNDMPTHFCAPRPGNHSAKPHEFYSIVETCSPGPWLEMFSRTPRNGWAAWGADANHT